MVRQSNVLFYLKYSLAGDLVSLQVMSEKTTESLSLESSSGTLKSWLAYPDEMLELVRFSHLIAQLSVFQSFLQSCQAIIITDRTVSGLTFHGSLMETEEKRK